MALSALGLWSARYCTKKNQATRLRFRLLKDTSAARKLFLTGILPQIGMRPRFCLTRRTNLRAFGGTSLVSSDARESRVLVL